MLLIFKFSFIKVKFSYGRIHFFKIIKNLDNSLFINSNVKFVLPTTEIIKKKLIRLLAQTTDKIYRKSISA